MKQDKSLLGADLMTRNGSWRLPTLLVCAAVLMVSGCGQKPDDSATDGARTRQQGDTHTEQGTEDADDEHPHDAHTVPETFPGAVAMLKEHYAEIKAAFEGGDGDQAHDALHCVGDVLEALPGLVSAAGLGEERTQAVQAAIEKILEAYGTVDEAMHQGEKADYAAVSATIDEQIAVLEQAAAGE